MIPRAAQQGLDAAETFMGLEPIERAWLAGEFEPVLLKRGDVLIREGEASDSLYIVICGRFAVTVGSRTSPIAEIGPNQPIGEIGFLAGGQRTATVTALRDSQVLRLGRQQFDRLSEKLPTIWRTLTISLARRIGVANARHTMSPYPRPRTIAVIPAGRSHLPARFVDMLSTVFARNATTRTVRADDLQTLLPSSGLLDSSEATRTLNALETAYDYVLFIADDTLTPWSETAIRQADMVLATALHAADVKPNALERLAANLLPSGAQRLVLLHEKHGTITQTRRWLEGREIAMHHHVALDEVGDFERLFRFISGTARGLVACGGGALCAAHIGLYKALIECGISFDMMGGTSGGAAMTAAFALGKDPDDVDRATHEMFVTNKSMRRYTWPLYSLVDHTQFDAQLSRHFGGIDIEDLRIPYFAVSANLSSHKIHAIRRGPLWQAVRASSSIPGLLPPFYTTEGEMLVDGALMDNVPIGAMRQLKSGPNVVVSFNVPKLERFDVNYSALPSRGELLISLLNPFRRRELPSAPGIASVLMRAMLANRSDFESHLSSDDLLLVPPCPERIGLLDWQRHGELKDATYRWARDEIPRLAVSGHPALASLAMR
jgi:NTE family protein